MSAVLQIIIGSILIILGAIGTIMFKNGIEKLRQPSIAQKEPQELEKENKQKIAKIQINRILEDATPWLEEKIEQDEIEINTIKQNANKRGMLYSGGHIVEQIKRVNSFIKSLNDYIKEMNRQIEDFLVEIEEEKFEKVSWLKEEYQKYSEFINASEIAKNNIKEKNNNLCSKLLDKPSFDAILKSNPYRD